VLAELLDHGLDVRLARRPPRAGKVGAAGRRAEPPALLPPGPGSLPQVGIRLAPRPRFHSHAVLATSRDACADSGCLRRLVTVQPVVAVKSAIEPARSRSMRSQ
jgi:hypothetical protein